MDAGNFYWKAVQPDNILNISIKSEFVKDEGYHSE